MNTVMTKSICVRTVTRINYISEFSAINYLINDTRFKFVSIDTDYPGQMFQNPRRVPSPASTYSVMKANVDDMKLIQVGISISDQYGNLPDFNTNNVYVWEVLISDFDQEIDWQYDEDSVNMLRTQGVNFRYNLYNGIRPHEFALRMAWCGLVGQENSPVTVITFNGAYDFGYLIKVIMNAAKPESYLTLPESLVAFLGLVVEKFGNKVYDVKHMSTKLWPNARGGLESIAKELGVTRAVCGGNRTASNALLALQMFHKIRSRHELDVSVVELLAGQIYNLCD